MNFYNEFDPHAAAWLRELIRQKQIPDGVVDERSIADVQPADLSGFTQCHFFAGIGGWSYALRLAGWPDDRPVWTGSVPCQPFSAAWKGKADADERHLWPVFSRLISECRPDILFGENVAGAIGFGWFDGISADLERDGYTVWAAVLGAHSAGAPHIRQRLYWMAYSTGQQIDPTDPRRLHPESGGGGGLGDTNEQGPQGRNLGGDGTGERAPGPTGLGFWNDYELVRFTDGKTRRVEPGTYPLAVGFPCRVDLLRGFGNAICPQIAAIFIQAAEESILTL